MDTSQHDEQLIALCRRLSGPSQSLDHLSLCDHNPDIMALFMERLGADDPARISNTLYSLVKELSSLNVPALQKLALLNQVYPLVLQCAEALSRVRLTPKTAQTIATSQALLKHLAAGFRTVVAGIGQEEISPLPQQQLVQAIAHTMEVSGLMYLRSLQFYLATPRHFWADVHLLYRIAEHCGIPRHKHGHQSDGQSLSIRCDYVRLLLIACCNPAQFPASDLQRLFKGLPLWVDTARLTDNDGTSLFVVDSDADLPPYYRSQLESDKQSGVRALNLERLVNYLEGKLYNNPDAALVDNFARHLVTNLCQSWSAESSRQSERSSENDIQVELVYGLSYSHKALAETNFEQFLRTISSMQEPSKDKFQLQEVDNSPGKRIAPRDGDVWRNAPDVARQKNEATPSAKAMSLSGAASGEQSSERDNLYPQLVNRSAQGACLEFPRGQHPKVLPGEVVCCRYQANEPWQLGLIRWKRITPHLQMQLGVELLTMKPHPRAARILRENKAAGPYLPALLLTSNEGVMQPPQVLLPVMPFKQGDRVHLLGGKRGAVATLSVPIDATSHVSRFTLENTGRQE
ncbi:hypothetical protein QSV34_13920 [Porticoccus sp. W117]|uniref:hypothetical protein n=1 Tax=Porticoccus sp. W117 TaxID=3054777 RepID=UPI002595C3BF|nr:hypothetical protein [Porticoccus sp. W117]MDM3872445.1 hypothetical protein [Porticoccus sp. W117]